MVLLCWYWEKSAGNLSNNAIRICLMYLRLSCRYMLVFRVVTAVWWNCLYTYLIIKYNILCLLELLVCCHRATNAFLWLIFRLLYLFLFFFFQYLCLYISDLLMLALDLAILLNLRIYLPSPSCFSLSLLGSHAC